jgi:hypothetical protein
MKYVIGVVALGLIIIDIAGISISPFSYGVFGLAALILLTRKESRIKKAKMFGIELEFEEEAKLLIEKTIDVSSEILKNKAGIPKKRKNKGLNGLPDNTNSDDPEVRFSIVPQYDLEIKEKSDELALLVSKLHSLHFSDSSKSLTNLIVDLRKINFENSQYLDLLERFVNLKNEFLSNGQLLENPQYFKRTFFIANQLIDFTKALIEGTRTTSIYGLS